MSDTLTKQEAYKIAINTIIQVIDAGEDDNLGHAWNGCTSYEIEHELRLALKKNFQVPFDALEQEQISNAQNVKGE